ncbi:hypothetical protein [Enterobacter cloacae]|uniref:hypothetical protein n=1 Tax=Enterobacter cloacae TaxID=550 RepID=UPI0021D36AC1|nr:hypothetical protein [Enterobacter cloacae]MCU6205130.1 hypothetical protein [Enterobacter cloacae]
MTNLDKRPYRADGGDIGTGRIREIADNPYGDEEKCWLAKRVLALQAQLEESERLCLKFQDANCELCQKLEAAENRIAELEAREVKLPPTFWYDHDDLPREIPVLSRRLVIKALREAGVKVAEAGKGE